ncbi:MAG: hypothetical protein J0L87_12465 [Bacteroidetes bacterium]|nr:hypothetical protein [Bacteroidota bacterium]
MIPTLLSKPKNVFLIDALGAFTTSFLLYFVLKSFNEYIGMPEMYYPWLSLIALLFCVYSAMNYFLFNGQHWKKRLKIISMANFSYCALTLALMVFHYSSFTLLGICYFTGEIFIVGTLAYMEWRMTKTKS